MAKRSKTTAATIAPPRRVPRAPWYSRDWFRGLLLVLLIFPTYQPVRNAGFVWDDDDHITANPTVIGPLGLKEIWTTGAGDIAPLTRSTFWLEYKLWGLSPLPYHVVNLLLQAACAILLWQILRKLRVPGAWLGAAIWTLHPLQVESIAWISEMKNTESGLFFLLAIFFFIGYTESDAQENGNWRYILMLLFAALAMVAKASTMVLPASLCICAWRLQGRWNWRNLVKMIPVAIMSVLASAMAIWATARRQAVSHDHPIVGTLPQRLIGAGDALWFYLGKLVWPHPLMALYPSFNLDASRWVLFLPLVAIIVALAVLWPGRSEKTRPYFFVLAWFVTALLPALGLVDQYTHRFSAGYSLVYDHFQYLASMAPPALAAAGIFRLTGRTSAWVRPLVGAVVLLVLAMISWQRVWAFESNETLWADAVAGNPDCWSCHYNLGIQLQLKGQLDQAVAQFQRAVDLNPDFAKAQNNLGAALSDEGRENEAITHFQKAVDADPDDADANYSLGSALMQKGQITEAIARLQKALELNPSHADAHNNLGLSFVQVGRPDEAVEQYTRALQLDPNHSAAEFNLGDLLARTGHMDDAVPHLQRTLEINPNNPQAHTDLGVIFGQRRQFPQATAQFQVALRLNPTDRNAQANLIRAQEAEAQAHLH